MDLQERRAIERRVVLAAVEGLVAAGCTITISDGEKIFLTKSSDSIEIEEAFSESGEPDFKVRRDIDGRVEEGWVDFVGMGGIEVTADEHLKLGDALQAANTLAEQLGVSPILREPWPDDDLVASDFDGFGDDVDNDECEHDNGDETPRKTADEHRAEGAVAYGNITLAEFYKALESHDWFFAWSDDPRAYWEGDGHLDSLESAALANGQAYGWLLAEFCKHMFSGDPWKTEVYPKPALPMVPMVNELIDLRADYESLAFDPTRAPSLDTLRDRAREMGALMGLDRVPPLVSNVDCLHLAWIAGDAEACEAHKRLLARRQACGAGSRNKRDA